MPFLCKVLDQGLELIGLHAYLAGRGIAGLRGIEPDRAIAPVIVEPIARQGVRARVLQLVEFEHRHAAQGN